MLHPSSFVGLLSDKALMKNMPNYIEEGLIIYTKYTPC